MNITWIFNRHWDPYPFILLNLMFSTQAAYTGPIIMISQNRQDKLQRRKEDHDRLAAEKTERYMLHLMEAVYAQGKVILDEIEEDKVNDCPGNS